VGYKKQSTMEDIFEICMRLPWWVGASLAVISYFVFHYYAVTEVINDGNVGQFTADNIVKSASAIMQYLFPTVCIAGSLASIIKRKIKK